MNATIRSPLVVSISLALLGSVSGQSVTTAFDDFESGTLSGGTNWASPWSGGTVGTSTNHNSLSLQHTGNSPQTVSRDFVPSVDNTMDHVITFDVAVVVDEMMTGNWGFRSYSEQQQNGTFGIAWKNDINGGDLTFHYGGGTFSVNAPGWNMATDLATIENFIYTFEFEIMPTAGQNSGQYNGTYNGTVTRSDGQSFSTGSQNWLSQNLSTSQFDELVFFNSSGKTTVEVDNVQIGDAVAVPEMSSLALLFFGLGLSLVRRR